MGVITEHPCDPDLAFQTKLQEQLFPVEGADQKSIDLPLLDKQLRVELMRRTFPEFAGDRIQGEVKKMGTGAIQWLQRVMENRELSFEWLLDNRHFPKPDENLLLDHYVLSDYIYRKNIRDD